MARFATSACSLASARLIASTMERCSTRRYNSAVTDMAMENTMNTTPIAGMGSGSRRKKCRVIGVAITSRQARNTRVTAPITAVPPAIRPLRQKLSKTAFRKGPSVNRKPAAPHNAPLSTPHPRNWPRQRGMAASSGWLRQYRRRCSAQHRQQEQRAAPGEQQLMRHIRPQRHQHQRRHRNMDAEPGGRVAVQKTDALRLDGSGVGHCGLGQS